ncbi:MAG TPA: hypothetical protein QGF35_00955, partial [Dehalococcoidia bacterium]|nr:hypothetical protein [Dehalococcoidia bacterium]
VGVEVGGGGVGVLVGGVVGVEVGGGGVGVLVGGVVGVEVGGGGVGVLVGGVVGVEVGAWVTVNPTTSVGSSVSPSGNAEIKWVPGEALVGTLKIKIPKLPSRLFIRVTEPRVTSDSSGKCQVREIASVHVQYP